MQRGTVFAMIALLVGLLTAGSAASAQMFNFAEHTPGYRSLAEGNRFYENGGYFNAHQRFEKAACWAEKMAQHNLGVMGYSGEGVERDPARAWAWFQLSAERDYPEFVGIANAVRDELDPDAHRRGQRIREEERGSATATRSLYPEPRARWNATGAR